MTASTDTVANAEEGSQTRFLLSNDRVNHLIDGHSVTLRDIAPSAMARVRNTETARAHGHSPMDALIEAKVGYRSRAAYPHLPSITTGTMPSEASFN